ncbi:MAG: hypothetical protein ACFFBC_00275 [Promethearchaeota archaeon]
MKKMFGTKKFKINKLVDLRLKHNKTYIYVNKKKFRVCVRIFLNIPVNRIHEANKIKSIDEILYGTRGIISQNHDITPEEEFRGHCSNIQAFFENGLNTNILDSNIAFPLLKKLVDVGYKPAIRVFKEEIARRYNEGTDNSRKFLRNRGYLNYLNEEEKRFHKCLL